jgi:hypothetical protein
VTSSPDSGSGDGPPGPVGEPIGAPGGRSPVGPSESFGWPEIPDTSGPSMAGATEAIEVRLGTEGDASGDCATGPSGKGPPSSIGALIGGAGSCSVTGPAVSTGAIGVQWGSDGSACWYPVPPLTRGRPPPGSSGSSSPGATTGSSNSNRFLPCGLPRSQPRRIAREDYRFEQHQAEPTPVGEDRWTSRPNLGIEQEIRRKR